MILLNRPTMSHLYENDECDKCMLYVRFIANSKTWKCVICDLVEEQAADVHEDYNIIWGRYQLRCEHEVHIRCFRKWCKINEMVGCVLCGPIEQVESNRFCNQCEQYGHSRC
jgi:hypothetical protein